MPHRNSNNNNGLHYLYEIWDKEEDTIFKFGISDDPVEEDNLLDRVREQVYLLNLSAGWIRYVGRVILKDIPGRVLAKKIENDYIHAYLKTHGSRPRGNPPRRKSKFDPPFLTNV